MRGLECLSPQNALSVRVWVTGAGPAFMGFGCCLLELWSRGLDPIRAPADGVHRDLRSSWGFRA